MLLTEVFQKYTETQTAHSTAKPLMVPLKLITVTPESMASLTDRQRKKISVLANKLRKATVPSIPPIPVKKLDRGFVLVGGLVRFLAYQKAGFYSIPAELSTDVVTEDMQRYIIYIDGKPNVYFDSQAEANKQANIIRQRRPSAKIEVKLGTVK